MFPIFGHLCFARDRKIGKILILKLNSQKNTAVNQLDFLINFPYVFLYELIASSNWLVCHWNWPWNWLILGFTGSNCLNWLDYQIPFDSISISKQSEMPNWLDCQINLHTILVKFLNIIRRSDHIQHLLIPIDWIPRSNWSFIWFNGGVKPIYFTQGTIDFNLLKGFCAQDLFS